MNAAIQQPDYLAVADSLLSKTAPGGWWPKVCALLLRMALEQAVDDYWRQTSPGVAGHASFRAKLLLMRRKGDRRTVRSAAYSWAVLSRALHYHAYDLDLTAAELRRLHAAISAVADALSREDQPGYVARNYTS